MRILKLLAKGAAIIGSVWVGYNMLILLMVANGSQWDYVPIVNWPLKALVHVFG